MRKITEQAAKAFEAGQNFKSGNTQVNQRIGGVEMLLHGHIIAIKDADGLRVSSAGWETNTTKERLNGLEGVSVSQMKGVWYLNGKVWENSREFTRIG